MSTSILTTKLYFPSTRTNLVHRSRLIDQLDLGLQGKLTLVSAPAGYGKTTLIAEWIRDRNHPVAWISLDDEDNILSRFLVYIITGIQQIRIGFGDDILAVLQAAESPQINSVMTLLINQISDIQKEFILVLDDYHLISNQSIHDAVAFLLEYLPRNLHLVLISRVDPPFTLPRLRVNGQLTEIRSNDLRFNVDEISTFLNQIMGFGLSEGDLRALGARTEGWIASLQLAALSLQGRNNKEEFITAFTGSHHYVIDYLVEEVLSCQTAEIQQFLIQSSIFRRFCAKLCDDVLEISNSEEIIQKLEVGNLFLISLDLERQWFRYHHLFGDFLGHLLNGKASEHISDLHRRASYWFEGKNFYLEAVNHALSGEDFEHAAQMIEKIGPDMMMLSEFDQLTRWLDAIPEGLVENWPWLCIIKAWMCQRWARLDEAERYLQSAEKALSLDTTPEPIGGEDIIQGQAAAIRALIALNRPHIPSAIEFAKQALALLPDKYFNRGVANLALGIAKKFSGEYSEANQALLDAYRESIDASNYILAQAVLLELGNLKERQGLLHQALETYKEAIQLKYPKTEIKIPYASECSIRIGNIYREWNDLETSLEYLNEGIAIGLPAQMVDAVAMGYAIMGQTYLAMGDLESALDASQTAERYLRELPNLGPKTITAILNSLVWIQLAKGNSTGAAKVFIDKNQYDINDLNCYGEFEQMIWARILINRGRESREEKYFLEAQELINRMLELTEQAGIGTKTIELFVLQALTLQELGKIDESVETLEKVLILAEAEEYVRIFLDEGKLMQELLQKISCRGIAVNYTNQLLTAFGSHQSGKQPLIAQPLVDSLSERELEVLRMLQTELSGPEIARELVVSLNTLRTHTKNIYSKLGVNNRRAAVLKSEEIGLL